MRCTEVEEVRREDEDERRTGVEAGDNVIRR